MMPFDTIDAFKDDRGQWHAECIACGASGPERSTRRGALKVLWSTHPPHTREEIRVMVKQGI